MGSLESDELKDLYEELLSTATKTLPHKQITVVTPLLGAGVNSYPIERSFTGLISALVSLEEKNLKNSFEHVIVVENDEFKMKKLKEFIITKMKEIKSPEYQWYWNENNDKFMKYDEDINT